jgi:hypothetical protein
MPETLLNWESIMKLDKLVPAAKVCIKENLLIAQDMWIDNCDTMFSVVSFASALGETNGIVQYHEKNQDWMLVVNKTLSELWPRSKKITRQAFESVKDNSDFTDTFGDANEGNCFIDVLKLKVKVNKNTSFYNCISGRGLLRLINCLLSSSETPMLEELSSLIRIFPFLTYSFKLIDVDPKTTTDSDLAPPPSKKTRTVQF